VDYRVGDVLRISCPSATARVTAVDSRHVSVRWPWWEIDPDAEDTRWNGAVAIARDDPDELYAVEPAADRLSAGDVCRVGIPPRIVHVIDVTAHDPPPATGWLPRVSLELLVLPAGQDLDPRLEFQGISIEPAGGVPLRLDLVFRPFASLAPGDDVADAARRAWRFDGPWHWTPYDGGGGVPTWPLTVLRDRTVVEGSAEAELARWRRAAGMGPGPARLGTT
jgi:hypothetical protein